jgi:hypothetical protein
MAWHSAAAPAQEAVYLDRWRGKCVDDDDEQTDGDQPGEDELRNVDGRVFTRRQQPDHARSLAACTGPFLLERELPHEAFGTA